MRELTPEERKLARELDFDEVVLRLVKKYSRRPLRHADRFDMDRQRRTIDGIAFDVDDGDAAERVLREAQPELLHHGYRAFWTEREGANGIRESDAVVVLKTTDHYSIIRMMGTDGANYGLFNEDIVRRLNEWEKQCRFQIVGAASSWVAIQFDTLPTNLCTFAEDAFRFCPDTVTQGVGLKREADDPESFAAARALCPDVSPQFQAERAREQRELEQRLPPDMFDQLRKIVAQISETSPEMGVRLLAVEIQRTGYLFLWWD